MDNPPATRLEISVVIPTRNRPELLDGTLAGLAAQSFDPSRWEVVVVLAGTDEASEGMVANWERRSPQPVRSVRAPAATRADARNEGIAAARGRIVLMLDDDVLPDPHLLEAHAGHHRGRDDTVVTGTLPLDVQSPEPAHRRKVRRWWSGQMDRKTAKLGPATFRDFVTGNVSVSRSRLLALGGFDPSFTAYGREDYELGYRLLQAGLRFVHEPRAVGVHRDRQSALEWLRRPREEGRADVHFVRKHPELADAVFGDAAFPRVPWVKPLVRLAEQLVVRTNDRAGRAWRWAAAYVQAAHYWRGVSEESRRHRPSASGAQP